MSSQQDDIDALFERLPENVQRALRSEDARNRVVAIGRDHGLSPEQIGGLMFETSGVMMGITHPSEYIYALTERLELPRDMVVPIAMSINERIFSPIKDTLKIIHGIASVGAAGGSGTMRTTPASLIVAETKPLPQSEPSTPSADVAFHAVYDETTPPSARDLIEGHYTSQSTPITPTETTHTS